jgi:hypothetical protein
MAFDLQRLRGPARQLMFRVATLAGVAFLVAAGLETGASVKLLRDGQHLEGEAIALGGPSGPTFIRFTRPDGGTTLFRPSRLAFVRPGQAARVIVDPRPNAAPAAATPTALWLSPALMAIVGALLFAFGFNRVERRRR